MFPVSRSIARACHNFKLANSMLTPARQYSKSANGIKWVDPEQDPDAPVIEIKIPPIPRVGEDLKTKRARLLYQSRKRGILETDLLLSNFAKKHLESLTMEQLEEYDKLLDEQDWDIYYWATRNYDMKPCPEKWEKSEIMAKLREIVENRERTVYRMPDL